MPKTKKATGVTPTREEETKGSKTAAAKKKKKTVVKSTLFEKTPRNYRIGGDIQPKKDLTRFVKWPKYVILQRMKHIMLRRLKVPPPINQFKSTIDKNQALNLLKLLNKYKPETRAEKKTRLREMADGKKSGKDEGKPKLIKYGLNHVTTLVENNKAKLVVIAHDVDPIELVCWLPALCRKKEVAYCIIKGKSRLGQLVHKKTASCVALETVRQEDSKALEGFVDAFKLQFNNKTRREWGGGIMGSKSQHVTARREKELARESAKKASLL